MKSYKIVLIISLIVSIRLVAFSQNLVPNGSFENYITCPTSFAQIYNATGWFQPHKYPGSNSVNLSSSSDYYNSCSGSSLVTVPINAAGFQFARTGNGYIGIAFYTPNVNGNAFREYAEIKLSQVLTENKRYNLRYYVCLANQSWFSITKFDAYFSNDSLLYTSQNLYKIPVTPQIQFSGRIDDTLNWVLVSGSFIALGGEKFLTLGNFQDGSVCDSLIANSNPTSGGAYYYIDDVSLEEDTITGINEAAAIDFTLYPNPSKNHVQISSQEIMLEVNVVDMRQKIIVPLKPNNSNTQIDVSQLVDGIYIVQCKFKKGDVLYKKMIVQH
ncbi:MAG TPA: T9SS type A sorting domain-containing protein [Bacteroidia bacterium]|nr:T9SS type A sorting domain-containing protein [Bacteroidia bacterium]HRH64525.1 T9SS type A sorting domain-containing protein [Bacteroidia bacterium]